MLQSEAFKEQLHPALDSVTEFQKAGAAIPVFLGEISAKKLSLHFVLSAQRKETVNFLSVILLFFISWKLTQRTQRLTAQRNTT